MPKKVTVIMPTQNEGVWLRSTVDSIMANAEYSDYEIAVVDDASTDGSCEVFKQDKYKDIVRVITIKQEEDHGPGLNRQRAFEATDSDLIITCDSHMVFSKGFMRKFVEMHERFPEAFLIAVSAGYRSVRDHRAITVQSTELERVKDAVKEALAKYSQPMMIEMPQLPKEDVDQNWGGEIFNTQKEYQHFFGYPVYFTKTTNPIIHVKSWDLDPSLPDNFLAYGCVLTIDKGDRNFITPKWTPWYGYNRKPHHKRQFIRVGGLMGACYLFPRQLLKDRIGGWTQYTGWVHEEEIMNIAAKLTGIDILCIPDIIAAHNYNRVYVSSPNDANVMRNKYTTIDICFNELREDLYKYLYGAVPEHNIPLWAREYQKKIQTHRIMSDAEFMFEAGLGIFLSPDERKRTMKALGVVDAENSVSADALYKYASQANLEAMVGWFNGLIQNPYIKSIFTVGIYQEEGKGKNKVTPDRTDFQCINACVYDIVKKQRTNKISGMELPILLAKAQQNIFTYSLYNSNIVRILNDVYEPFLAKEEVHQPAEIVKEEKKIIKLNMEE